MIAGEVVLVNRNVTDSFRVGNGCIRNNNCGTSSATCQFESGLCFCSVDEPNFLHFNASSSANYQCVNSASIRAGVGECL